ncbi:MAG: NnrU family protein [Pseudomonadota bacterium]
MLFLILGLALFIGAHLAVTLRGFRSNMIARLGEAKWKLALSTVSLLGLALIAYGFGEYRAEGYRQLYDPPLFLRHLALVLNLPVFILIAAAYLPGHIKRIVKHPMLLGIKLWAMAHLFANGDLGSVLLFGSFLIWAVYARINVKARELAEPRAATTGSRQNDMIAVLVGLVAYLIVVKWLHLMIIGVQPV